VTSHGRPENAKKRKKSAHRRCAPALEPSWRAHADQLTYEQPEIEAADVDQQPLANVSVATQEHATHAAGVVEMREGTFETFTAEAQEALAAFAADAAPVAIDGGARLGILLPIPATPIGFRDVTANAHGFEIDQRVVL